MPCLLPWFVLWALGTPTALPDLGRRSKCIKGKAGGRELSMVVLDGVVKVESSRHPVGDGAARGTGHGQKDPRMSDLHDGAGEGVRSSEVLTSESQKTVNAASSMFQW